MTSDDIQTSFCARIEPRTANSLSIDLEIGIHVLALEQQSSESSVGLVENY